MVLIAVMFTALGTAIACSLTDMQGFQMVMNFLVMPIYFLSGALFPLTNIPMVMKFFATIDPLSYGVDGMRGALIGESTFGAARRCHGPCGTHARYFSASARGNFRGSRRNPAVARTPSVAAHEKVLDAAIHLIGERGIEGTSMDAIAQVSGVSKATVYKHWKDKETLCIDVIVSLREVPPEFHSGDTRRDLIDLVTHLSKADRPDRLMKIWPRIIGYAAANPKFADALKEHSFGPGGRRSRES